MPKQDECKHVYGASTWLGQPDLVGKNNFNPTNDIRFKFCPLCGKELKKE